MEVGISILLVAPKAKAQEQKKLRDILSVCQDSLQAPSTGTDKNPNVKILDDIKEIT